MYISFVKKVILTCVLAASAAMASPAQTERTEFCQTVVNNVAGGAKAQAAGMPEDVLYDMLQQYAFAQFSKGMSQADVRSLVISVLEGYAAPDNVEALQEKLYKACLSQTEI